MPFAEQLRDPDFSCVNPAKKLLVTIHPDSLFGILVSFSGAEKQLNSQQFHFTQSSLVPGQQQ